MTSSVVFVRSLTLRASRLLHMLLLLQNRGRQTSAQLARELEVTPRTILRDVDALTEAGLPIIVHQGNKGGIELGFNYRSRLTGFAADEAEAMAVLLSRPCQELAELGLADAAKRARAKWIESVSEATRETIRLTKSRIRFEPAAVGTTDPRIEAMAGAVRRRCVVEIKARSSRPRTIHPICLIRRGGDWCVVDAQAPLRPIPIVEWADIKISVHTFRSDV
jgi:predicted DNA-binding transcriptional regulator YafY